MQYSLIVRNAQNDAMAQTVGPAPTLEIRSGPTPARCDLADTGMLIAVGTLPADWITQSVEGITQRNGQWQAIGTDAAAAVPVGHFRIKSQTVCCLQGTYGAGMEMIPDAGLIAPGQVVNIQQFQITRGNA